MFIHIIFFKVKGTEWLRDMTLEAEEDEED
jgi:hypothetical protein